MQTTKLLWIQRPFRIDVTDIPGGYILEWEDMAYAVDRYSHPIKPIFGLSADGNTQFIGHNRLYLDPKSITARLSVNFPAEPTREVVIDLVDFIRTPAADLKREYEAF